MFASSPIQSLELYLSSLRPLNETLGSSRDWDDGISGWDGGTGPWAVSSAGGGGMCVPTSAMSKAQPWLVAVGFRKQLDAAEEAASRSINLPTRRSIPALRIWSYPRRGVSDRSTGKTEKTIRSFEVALETSPSFNWHDPLF